MPPRMEPHGSVPACSGTKRVRGGAQREPDDEDRFPKHKWLSPLRPGARFLVDVVHSLPLLPTPGVRRIGLEQFLPSGLSLVCLLRSLLFAKSICVLFERWMATAPKAVGKRADRGGQAPRNHDRSGPWGVASWVFDCQTPMTWRDEWTVAVPATRTRRTSDLGAVLTKTGLPSAEPD